MQVFSNTGMHQVKGRSAVQLYALTPSSLAESCHLLLLMHTSYTYNTYRIYTTVKTLRGKSFAINGESPESLDVFLSRESSGRKAGQTTQYLHGVPSKKC